MTQPASGVHLVDFNALPLSARERLVACLRGHEEPVPIVAEPSRVGARVITLVATLLGSLALLALLVAVGLGTVGSQDALQGPGWLFFYWLATFLPFAVLLTFVHGRVVRGRLPYPPGRYLLPFDIVDASSPRLRIRPLAGVVDARGLHHQKSGGYSHSMLTVQFEDGTTEALRVEGRSRADAILARFWEVQHEIHEAAEREDWDTFAALDPLYEVRWLDGGFDALPAAASNTESAAARSAPVVLRKPVLLAAAAAFLVTPLLWGARNLAGDVALHAAAQRADTEAAYQHYVSEGWLHVDQMRSALPHVAFRQAKKKGTVTALRAMLKRYPRSPVEADVRAEVHRLFAQTLERFRGEAAAADPRMLAFMERLLAHLEATDNPTVHIRFKSPGPTALAAMDRTLSRRAPGRVAPIAPHFELQTARGREDRIVLELKKGFAKVFPADVMVLEAAPRLEGTTAPGPVVGFQIVYDVAPSGAFYESDSSRPFFFGAEATGRVFVGIKIGFDVTLAAPGGPPIAFKMEVAPPKRFTVETHGLGGDPSDERVYRVMADRAFDQLSTKLAGTFFRKVGGNVGDGAPAPSR